MELETLILSEVSQKERDKYHMISLTSGIYSYMPQINLSTEKKLTDLEKRLVVAKAGGGDDVGAGEVGWTGNLGLIDANYCIWKMDKQ